MYANLHTVIFIKNTQKVDFITHFNQYKLIHSLKKSTYVPES